MCNAFGILHPITVINQRFSERSVPLLFPNGAPNLEPRPRIAITEPAPIVRARPDDAGARAGDGGFELVSLRWGFKPASPRAGPVFNFRSEGRRFPVRRCLIPASYFYEFTSEPEAKKSAKKARWRFALPDGAVFAIAGLWRGAEGDVPPAFTMLTCEPGPDIAPLHDRQVVCPPPEDWAAWLDPKNPEPEALLRPSPAGMFEVTRDN